jgi:catechol 2,3-dioxygenase-like lactoylglutathione lyase family enzyme
VKISLTTVLVQDQEKALRFYTEILGFLENADIPMGGDRWVTLVSPHGPQGVELLLEPTRFAPAKTYQQALYEGGIPLTASG